MPPLTRIEGWGNRTGGTAAPTGDRLLAFETGCFQMDPPLLTAPAIEEPCLMRITCRAWRGGVSSSRLREKMHDTTFKRCGVNGGVASQALYH